MKWAVPVHFKAGWLRNVLEVVNWAIMYTLGSYKLTGYNHNLMILHRPIKGEKEMYN